ncbi:DUF3119 family protein [Gloeocapsa sp. PCC 73106]|uniref:DUF3119 family protein n=1 Tax=Gloeocapsa sp. PCC 73106 TaxID=102232 RepID=UPI0002F97B88|nr:DUF3119 family protein [Gloeocapsa sp. PCC 73106]
MITNTDSIILSPSYTLPLWIILLALPLSLINLWLGLVVALFGLFLMVQTATIRLGFTPTSLEVYRSEQIIRVFPYADWLSWQIFWTRVPVLFYFREVKSIHFLPIIFDSKTLKLCLEKYCTIEKPLA